MFMQHSTYDIDPKKQPLFRYSDGRRANSALGIYCVLMVALVLQLLSLNHPGAMVAAGFLLSHVLILLAYLVHDCIHNAVFSRPRHNDILGAVGAWLLGAGVCRYARLKEKHRRHHSERRDILSMDYRLWLQKKPLIKNIIGLMHSLGLPAAEWLCHVLAMSQAWRRSSGRKRLFWIMLSRLVWYVCLGLIHPALPILYFLSLLLCYAVLGFMDCFQHQYTMKLSLDESRAKADFDRDYEETHTFSNLLSSRLPCLNLFVLNFCYHNVHHWKSGEPWHRLPRLHRQRYASGCANEISLAKQLQLYWRHRRQRLEPQASISAEDNIGAAGVSFLVGY